MVTKVILTGLLSTAAVFAQFDASSAQSASPERYTNSVQRVSVGNRARGDYDSLGVRAGSYFFYPYTLETFSYDDNVFASRTNESEDWVLISAPTLLMLSNWGQHQLDFKFGAVDYRHREFDSENRTDVFGQSDWRIDVSRDFNIAGTLGVAQLHEARGQSDTPTAASEPVEYRKYDATLSLNKQFNRLSAHVGGGVERLDYDDVLSTGGININEDVRDGNKFTAVGKLAYEFSPGFRFFGLAQGNERRYDEHVIDNRDSKGIEGRAGLEFEVTHLVTGEISGGYMMQDYDSAAFDNTTGYAFHGALTWNPTQLMTVNLSGDRIISETTVAAASGHVDTLVSASVDYEILRNLIGSPYVRYTIEDYQGVNREDKTLQAGVSLQMLLNRYMSAGAYYAYTTKDSNDDTYDYDKNVVGGMLKVQF